MTLRRARFEAADSDQVLVPADQQLDLPAGCEVSPALAERSMWLATQTSFVQVQEGLRRLLRVSVCDSVLDRLMQKAGSVAGEDRKAELTPLLELSPQAREESIKPLLTDPPQRLFVSCDGVRFPTRNSVEKEDGSGKKRRQYREIKCGMVFWEDPKSGWRKQVICGREETDEFGLRLWSLAVACGMNQAREVIFISDGGRWCEQVHRDYFGDFPRILDFYHLQDHVVEASKLVYLDPERAKAWKERCMDRLEQRSSMGLLLMLKHSVCQHQDQAKEAIEDLIGYLEPRLDFTAYNLYRQKGWIIGSGAMESTCKQVVSQRLKGSGRQWSEKGAEAMAQLVTLRLNNQWDSFWQDRPLQRAA